MSESASSIIEQLVAGLGGGGLGNFATPLGTVSKALGGPSTGVPTPASTSLTPSAAPASELNVPTGATPSNETAVPGLGDGLPGLTGEPHVSEAFPDFHSLIAGFLSAFGLPGSGTLGVGLK